MPTIADYLKYANLQMAAEALFGFNATPPGTVLTPSDPFQGEIDPKILTTGNLHASKFTTEEAKKFASEWKVVEHISNTTTGFSGTLFEKVGTGELVLSFRSTEFLDDAARDNTATNVLEIKEKGWAFGQISDMDKWYADLKSSGKIPSGARFSVTGYSLGGHLATAFNLMHGNEMNGGEVVTFNGAGVGKIGDGSLATTQGQLPDMIHTFEALRQEGESSGLLRLMQSSEGRAAYLALKAELAKTNGVPRQTGDANKFNTLLEDLIRGVQPTLPDEPGAAARLDDYGLLYEAVSRTKQVFEYAHWAPTLGSGAAEGPPNPANVQDLGGDGKLAIAAESLDYQLAVLATATQYQTQPLGLLAGGQAALGKPTPAAGGPLTNQWDIAGTETTTDPWYMVAYSQYRYGNNVNLFIEDQPFARGSAVSGTIKKLMAGRIQLLHDQYDKNDFGDTHSLVLIVDSLNVQNAILNLLPEALRQSSAATLAGVLKAASWHKAESTLGTQGQAEGDVLENVVNALADLFLGPQQKEDRLNGSPNGNTWAKTDASYTGTDGKTYSGREALYKKLKSIVASAGYDAFATNPTLTLEAATGALATRARSDFGAFAALYSLSPFVLKGEGEAIATAVGGAWQDTYNDWKSDRDAHASSDRNHEDRITDTWLADRAEFLRQKNYFNASNKDPYNPDAVETDGSAALADAYFEDVAADYKIQQGRLEGSSASRYYFGADEGDQFTGGDYADQLYGGAGNDTLDGGKGADYLEGNAGTDELKGGEGKDTLLGGAGDDTLEGGKDNDILLGGTGDNTYVFKSGDGQDTIDDKNTAGQGRILIGTDTLTGGKEEIAGSGLWLSQDKKYKYTLTTESDGSNTLLILSGDDRLIVKDFTEGKLGISLGVAPVVVVPAPANAVVENPNRLVTSKFGETASWSLTGHDSFNNIYAGNGNDLLQGLGGYDRLYGGAGDDRIFGSIAVDPTTALANAEQAAPWEAGDYLSGDSGNDLLVGTLSTYFLGGDGRDTIIGGGSMDIVYGDGMAFSDNYSIGGAPWAYDPTFVLDRRDDRSTFYVRFDVSGTEARYDRLSWLPETAGDDGGADLIFTGAGNDIALGDYGRDRLDLGSGNDTGIGGHDDDIVDGGAGNDQLFGDFNWDAGEGPQGETETARLIRVGLAGEHHGRDILDGGAGDDYIEGNGRDDIINGGDGNDTLVGDDYLTPEAIHGADSLDGGAGNDIVLGGGDGDELRGGDGDDELLGEDETVEGQYHGSDVLYGDAGNDSLWGWGGNDTLSGGEGNDYLEGDADQLDAQYHGKDTLDGGAGNDVLFGDGKDDLLNGGEGNDTLHGNHDNDVLLGGAGSDGLWGDEGNDVLTGGTGTDALAGGVGNDTYVFRAGDGSPAADGSIESIADTGGSDVVRFEGLSLNDIKATAAGGGMLLLEYGASDKLAIVNGMNGDVEYFEADGERRSFADMIESRGAGVMIDYMDFSGNRTIVGGGDANGIVGWIGNDRLSGGGGNDTLQGAEGNDSLLGGAGDDVLDGGAGNDTLHGGAGDDVLKGGAGNDAYRYSKGDGNDTIINDDVSSFRADTLVLEGIKLSEAVIARQNTNDLVIRINPTGESITVKDSFLDDKNRIDSIAFADGASISGNLATLRGSNGDDALSPILAGAWTHVYGNGGNDTLTGSAEGDVLDGGDDNDLLYGQGGNDQLFGGAGDDTFFGGDGSDFLSGGAGNDTYHFGRGSGNDTIEVNDSSSGRIETLVLDGLNATDIRLERWYTPSGSTLSSNLRIVIKDSGEAIWISNYFESDSQKLDEVRFADGSSWGRVAIESNVSFYNGSYASEEMSAVGGIAAQMHGQAGNDTITGGSGDDYLRGDNGLMGMGTPDTDGSDFLSGGDGNDTLDGNGGSDRLLGGSGNDSLDGGAGNDTLDGGSGSDLLAGGAGSDTYVFRRGNGNDVIDNNDTTSGRFDTLILEGLSVADIRLEKRAGDLAVVIRDSGETITVQSHFTYASHRIDLISFPEGLLWHVDQLLGYLGIDVYGTGDNYALQGAPGVTNRIHGLAGSELLIGESEADMLDGGDGNDTLYGGGGNDSLAGGSGNDSLEGGTGYDLLEGGAGDDVLSGEAGNDSLMGGSGNDVLNGDEDNDLIDGGSGDDSLVGGPGNNTYVFQRGGGVDTITSFADGGYDTLNLNGLYASDVIVEKRGDYDLSIVIQDTGESITVSNFFLSNDHKLTTVVFADGMVWDRYTLLSTLSITGTDGDDTLSGAADVPIRIYGLNGNDVINGNSQGDTLVGGAGNDTLNGLSGNDSLMGGTGDDSIQGGDGDDTIDGGSGNDWLAGGSGNDTYVFRRGSGSDTIYNHDSDSGRWDSLLFEGLNPGDVHIEKRGDWDIAFVINDTSESITVKLALWGFGEYPLVLDEIKFADGTNWDWISLLSTLGVDVRGTAASERLSAPAGIGSRMHGLDGNDTLNGGSGNDALFGDGGNDLLNGGAGNDTYVFHRGDGVDTINNFDESTDRVDSLVLEGLNVADIQVENRGSGDVAFVIKDTGEAIVVDDFLYGDEYKIDRVTFADGTTWDRAAILDHVGVHGTAGDDYLSAPHGVDSRLFGYAGNDTLYGGTGNDRLSAGDGNDYLEGREGDDSLAGDAGDDTLFGGLGNDSLDGGAGNDVLTGASGDDVYVFRRGGGTDRINNYDVGVGRVDSLLLEGLMVEDVRLEQWGLDLAFVIKSTGESIKVDYFFNGPNYRLDNVIFADGTVWDQATMIDQVGIFGTNGNDTLTAAGSANSRLFGYGGDDFLNGADGNDLLDGGDGNDTLQGNAGSDTMIGGAGDDTYIVDNAGDVVTENAGEGIDLVRSGVTHTLSASVENLILTGSSFINGTGNALANTLTGNGGNNVLDGGAGADTLIGGAGNDTFVIDNAGDVIVENAGEGTDTIQIGTTYTLGSNLENLTLTGTGAINGTGNDLANALTGNSGNNTLDGGTGNDTMAGGTGNDTYLVDSASDVVTEAAGAGTDLVQSSVTHTLASNVENLTLTGSAAINGTGNTLANVLIGNSGNNTLSGGTGADTMIGGAGNDTYVVDAVGDVVTENAAEGTDLVQSSVTYTLSANVENLTLTGTSAINGTGNDLANVLTGNSGNNILNGGAGADTLVGGAGNDTYVVDDAGDVITEGSNAGTDLVQSSVTYSLATNVENLTLTGTAAINGTGNTLANTLTGNSGNNVLDGGTGADTLIGGAGNDTYVVDNTADVVTEGSGAGTDLVQSSVTYTLAANVEHLTLTGTSAINGTGNTLANVLTGNAGNNTLSGGTGADTLIGGAGNDTYVVDNAGDVVTENAAEGTDLVQSSVTYTLSANVENLTLTGTANINGTGNDLANVLTGNTGANRLTGGAGNDTYVVDNAGDVVVEASGEGTDLVQSSITHTLAANVENLTLTGTNAINGTGNDLANVLTGNSAENILDGKAGNDTLVGGAGNDTYYVGTGDTVTEGSGAGTDTVISDVTWTLGSNIENLTLIGSAAINGTGNTLANLIIGNGANNTLSGGSGADTMQGGAGDDTYVVDNIGDVVTEGASAGTDLVQTSVTYTLAANVENLTLTGSTAINGTGNALDNVLTGNSGANTLTGGAGNDTLNGGSGADTLLGGLGDDTYTVDNTSDIVTENAGEGIDLVNSSVTLTLAANVEALALSGSSALNGTGNALDNLLRGNTGANTLNGGTGNDILEGGAGNDILTDTAGTALFNGGAGTDTLTGGALAELYLGGLGNDTYTTAGGNDVILFNKGDGQDTFATGGTGSDTVSLGGGIAYTDLSFSKATNDLVLKVGATDQITFKNWYATTPSKPVLNLQVIAEAMADFAAGGSDPLRDQKVENFNFAGLAGAFDAARTANPGLTSWALTNALASFQLAGSDSAALGGDLAYQYGKNGTLTGIGLSVAQQVIGDTNFGTQAQMLQPLAGLQEGAVRLS